MTLAEQIDLILSNRKKKSENLRKRKEELAGITLVLKNGKTELISLAKKISDDALRAQYLALVSGLNTKEALKQIDHLIRRMDEGIKRFDRDYISIATIGKERQGKSQFLQSVGNLDNNIIPAYDAITFRQRSELLDIVKSYILELDPHYFEENSLAFEDIGYIEPTAFNIEIGNATQASALKHLSAIGDTKQGIEEAMLDTVDRECDAAIVVTKPISGIQTSDQSLYNMLRERFKFRDTKLWLFYLANHHVGQNDKTVGVFANEIKDEKWLVADCRVVDSSRQTAVRDDFLMPMLKTLIHNMDAIDGAYLQELNEQEKEARRKIRELLEALPALEVIDTNSKQGQEAYEKGKQCFNRMTAELKKLVFQWSLEKDRPNTVLWNSVQSILNNLDGIIPPAERIQAISDSNGSLLGEPFWEMMLHYVRNEITDRFILIDDVLEKQPGISKILWCASSMMSCASFPQAVTPRRPTAANAIWFSGSNP